MSDNGQSGSVQQSDAITVDLPIAYVQRPLPLDEDGNPAPRDVLDPSAFNPGAVLVLKARASATAAETILTEGVFPKVIPEDADPDSEPMEPLYDVKDLEVSADGKYLLFAMRAPEIEDADDDEQPTWNIWEYAVADKTLRRVISSDLQAERGEDVSPHYLPDGRIIFASTRQVRTRAILLDEGKPAYPALDDDRREINMVLHRMDDDGTNIEQLSYNVSQDLQPSLMNNGDLLFLRQDSIGNKNGISLYRSKPDGSDVQVYYGYHNQDTGTDDSEAVLYQPRELPDGRILAILQPRSSVHLGGDIVAIDGENFVEIDQPTRANFSATGSAQTSLATGNVDTEGVLTSFGGYFSSAYPLYDGSNRLLTSWSQCRLIDPTTLLNAPCTDALEQQGALQAAPLFGLWIYDTENKTQLPVKIPQEGTMYSDAVVISPRPFETTWQPSEIDPGLVTEQVGVVHIRSVYDIDGLDSAPGGTAAIADPSQTPADQRQVRFIRIVKNVPIPDDDVLDFDNAIFGRSTNQGMRDIIGYVPVEPDGSAKFKVPADIPVMFDLLDGSGKRIGSRHENWLYLRPGEQRECTGCHTRNSELPHGRRDAEATSPNPGATGGIAFPSTQLRDAFGTPEAAPEFGESMAEYYSRIFAPRTPSVDLIFSDDWTDPAAATPGDDIALRYVTVAAIANANPRDSRCAARDPAPPQWKAPVLQAKCAETGGWDYKCRTTINYVQHIQPLWDADRRTCDDLGTLIANDSCTSCHSRGPADAVMIPFGQLELTGEVSTDQNDYITSYAELMFQDNEQELVGNALVDIVIEQASGDFETDANGDPVLDDNGNPIPIINLINITVNPAMSTDGANASNRFFNLFNPGGSHYGRLSPDELKLIAEWLDIGGQYYNNPFDAPAN